MHSAPQAGVRLDMRLDAGLRAKDKLLTHNLGGCVCFGCLVLLGALLGRAVFLSVYEQAARALVAALPGMLRPRYRSAEVLLSALLPPMAYCAVLYVSGLRRALLPLWGAAVLVLGIGFGMQLGMASALIHCGRTADAWLTLLTPMLILLPLSARVALLPLERSRRAGERGREGADAAALLAAALPSVALCALSTLHATFSCIYLLGALFA